jgi:chorismate mutase / prephenate dehydratase
MSTTLSDLADLRRRIDAIDARMHDLLIERAGIVAEVAANKRDGDVAFYQPAREAQILRRLAARHHGVLALASVLRIWRELLAATVRLETPFAVAVCAPPQAQGFWDLARDHYGSHTPISAYASTGQVIRAVRENDAAVGILSLPRASDPDPWWPHLASPNSDGLQVIARLPFGPRGNARSEGGDALVIGRSAPQQTGADRTLFIAELGGGFSRAWFLDQLSSAGLDYTLLALSEQGGATLKLVEVEDFVPLFDPRIAAFRERLGARLYRLVPFGGYAVPLPMAASLPDAAKG